MTKTIRITFIDEKSHLNFNKLITNNVCLKTIVDIQLD